MYALPYILLVRLHRLALDARRRHRGGAYYGFSFAAALLASLLISAGLFAAWAMFYVGWWFLGIAVIVIFVTPPLQPILSRRILVPLGLVRTSFWVAHFVSMHDSDAYALCCAAWAHSVKPKPADEAWLIAKRDKRVPLGDAEIIMTALLAAARGDVETTRQLMRSTGEMVENHPLVRELAGEWLAVDAVSRHAWQELHDDATVVRWPATALTFFLEGVAARNLGAKGAPSAVELRVRWLLAPRRRVTRRVLNDIVARKKPGFTVQPNPGDPVEMPPASLEPTAALPRALATHLMVVANRAQGSGALASAVSAWDAALLDGATQKWLAQRALELDAPLGAVDRVLRDVATTVTDELGRIADTNALGVPASHGPVGAALTRRLRHGRLDALEAGFTRWEERRHSGAVRAPIDEWREWVALRSAYDAAVTAGGLELRRLAFPHAYSKGTSMAVWLWNTRNEYALSHAISKWLLGEALTVGDTEAIELCSRNVKLTVPTRTGEVSGK